MTRRQAIAVLCGVLLVFFAPVLVRGAVVYPHDNSLELAAPPVEDASAPTVRRFRDLSSVYVPHVHHHLNGQRAGWIATWNPHVELGHPATHLGGYGRAFPLTFLLSLVTRDALTVTTWLAVSALVLAALFGFLFLESLGLHPAAALAGSLGLALGVSATLWMNVPLLLWPLPWGLACLWCVNRYLERRRPGHALFLAFAVYALVTTGYPQEVFWIGLLVAAFALARLAGPATLDRARPRLRLGLELLGLAAAGLACAAPLIADLVLESHRSGRLGLEPAFFLPAVPHLEGPGQVGRFVAFLHDAFWWGNPVDEAYPFNVRHLYDVMLGPLTAVLVVCALGRGAARGARLWGAFALVGLLLTVWPAAYLFAVEHLGLSLSRLTPLKGVLVPLSVLAALGADRLLRSGRSSWRLVLVAALPLALALVGGLRLRAPLDPLGFAVGLAIALGALVFVARPRPALLAGLAVAGVLATGYRLRLLRPRSEIRESSELVERLVEATRDRSRLAFVGDEPLDLLPPNQETMFGLRSIHAYDSLAPWQFREWVRELWPGGMTLGEWGDWKEIRTRTDYGRRFSRVAEATDLAGETLSWAGVGLFVSRVPLDERTVAPEAELAGYRLYRPLAAPLREAQLTEWATPTEGEVRLAGRLHEHERLPVERTEDLDDRLRFRLTARPAESLLFVGQEHHPHWRAFAGDRELATVRVNGLWQGVLVPPGTESVELRFLPWIRLAWIPYALFSAGALLVLALRLRAPRALPPAGPAGLHA